MRLQSCEVHDYQKNVREWEAAGGKGVQFEPGKDIVQEVEHIIADKRQEKEAAAPNVFENQERKFNGYDALFIEADVIESLRRELGIEAMQLPVKPQNYHVTISYYGYKEPNAGQKQIQDKWNGQVKKCTIIGYGNDGKNEGFLCEGTQNDRKTPFHITLSMAPGAKAVDTGKLEFKKLEYPIKVYGTFLNSLDERAKDPKYKTASIEETFEKMQAEISGKTGKDQVFLEH